MASVSPWGALARAGKQRRQMANAWQIPLETRNSWALALSPDGQRVAVGCPCPRRQATFHFHLAMKG
jgi:hypothetical protein